LSRLSFNLGIWLSGVGAIALAFGRIWIRVSFCRFRYDLLINFSWKCLLPLVLRIFLIRIILYV
jgi:NADH:ubiquinone oxidoreductase subunit H